MLPTTFDTYRAQLTFGLGKTKQVHVAALFGEWATSCFSLLKNFSLLPYNDTSGCHVSTPSQLPDNNPDFYSQYFQNHRVLSHGNLTGMVAFQCSTPWGMIKGPTSSYFQWLKQHKVYLNQTKFQADTVVLCSFSWEPIQGFYEGMKQK
jgi:hypothetical protein